APASNRQPARNRALEPDRNRMVVWVRFMEAARLYETPFPARDVKYTTYLVISSPSMEQMNHLYDSMLYNSTVICRYGETSEMHSFRPGRMASVERSTACPSPSVRTVTRMTTSAAGRGANMRCISNAGD